MKSNHKIILTAVCTFVAMITISSLESIIINILNLFI